MCGSGDENMAKNGTSKDKEQYSVRVDVGIPDAMKVTVPPGMDIGHVWTMAARIWLDLPEDVRKDLLIGRTAPDLVAVVRRVVQEEIDRRERGAEDLASRHRRKQDPKGRVQ
jgi:hypothetical protein